MNASKARRAVAQAKEMLQAAQWTAREIQVLAPGPTMDGLLEQLHHARLAMEQASTELEQPQPQSPAAPSA